MDNLPEGYRSQPFASREEFMKQLREKADDFNSITIMVVNDLPLRGPQGELRMAKDGCALVKLVSGESLLIHRDDLQEILNDGILHRMKIPIRLLPERAP